MKVGDKIPEFTLYDQDGEPFSSHSLIGKKNFVLFFYPLDGLPICIREACAFRNAHHNFVKSNFEVFGVSSDNELVHKKFKKTYKLPYRLLVDENAKVRELLEIPPMLFGLLPGRVTFVVDKEGIIRKIFNSPFSASSHVKEAISTIKK
jgi:Peroxiredoxin